MSCVCKPMNYHDSATEQCKPCGEGCYICIHNATNCKVCLDGYSLYRHYCHKIVISYTLLGSVPNSSELQGQSIDPCMIANSNCTPSNCTDYTYEGDCLQSCPNGSFPLIAPSLQCINCRLGCTSCQNYTFCDTCASRYYLDPIYSLCSLCGPNCLACNSSNWCL